MHLLCVNLKIRDLFCGKIYTDRQQFTLQTLTLYHCTCLKHNQQHYRLDEDFSWSRLGLAGPSPWVRILHAFAFHWIPITAPEKAKILKCPEMKGILGAVILRWSPEGSVATSFAARRGRDTRLALVDYLEEFGGNT